MKEYLIFGGTTEGRILCESLLQNEEKVHIYVATEYGEEVLLKHENLMVHKGRLDQENMEQLFLSNNWEMIIDATHPYATIVSDNVKKACDNTGRKYIRIIRSKNHDIEDEDTLYMDSFFEAVNYLNQTKGNILLTTGSKELASYVEQIEDITRIYARILPDGDMVDRCKQMGLSGKQIICMQGPFSEEMNCAMIRQLQVEYVVTKDTGNIGGFPEKIKGARIAGAKVLVIKRPIMEQGYSLEKLLEKLHLKIKQEDVKQKVTLLGIGMGMLKDLTIEGEMACKNSDVILGAERMVESLKIYGKETYPIYKSEEIIDFIETHPQKNRILVAFSGDIGFYSGTKKLLKALKDKGCEAELLPGISSVVYFSSKLKTSWEDVKLVSVHGRQQNLIAAVQSNNKVFSLAGYAESIRHICEELLEYHLEHVKVSIGCQLSYPDEKIVTGYPKEFLDFNCQGLCVVMIENDNAGKFTVTHGLSDEMFERGNAPMTKEEIRSISLSKLALRRDSIIYDVGAGTGSIGLECARIAYDGMVYAIEKKEDALNLLRKNKKRLGVSNLEIIPGIAPDALLQLPIPTHAFIGGSSGNMKEIIDNLLCKNKNIRIVINCIALETVAEVMILLKDRQFEHVDIVHAAIGKSKTLGSYHMMMGQNPVYIITLQGECL